MNDLLGGQFDVMCDQTTNTTNQIKEGRIKGYAVTTKTKVSSLPDLPTLDSTALPGFEVTAWHAMWAPKGLPKDVTDKLVAALQAALKDPKVIERFADLGTEPVPLSSRNAGGAEVAGHIGSEALGCGDQGRRRQGQLKETDMKTYTIAAIPGDGIGTEVVSAGVEVLQALAKRDGSFAFKVDHFDWGGEYYKKHGRMMPENGRDLIRKHDAILFGSAGHPDIPDHITLWGLRLAICQPFDQYANVRPTRVLPGITSPLRHVNGGELDWVIVRENSEGEYAGVGGRVHQGSPLEVATDVAMFTRAGVERIMRFAFKLARSRPRKLLTVVTKSNAQRHAMVMWDEIAVEVAKEFPDVTWDKMLVDAMTMRMVIKPQSIDTVVATNLHADILSDLAAALAGSLGIAPTANLNPERTFPSMFEPIHGSAFDIMGKGIANPIGTFWSAVMMLEHLGETAAARPPDEGDRARHRRSALPHARPRRQGADGRRDGGGDRGDREGECVAVATAPYSAVVPAKPGPVTTMGYARRTSAEVLIARHAYGSRPSPGRHLLCRGVTACSSAYLCASQDDSTPGTRPTKP